eukprot:1767191-Rhodomonas_salina.1
MFSIFSISSWLLDDRLPRVMARSGAATSHLAAHEPTTPDSHLRFEHADFVGQPPDLVAQYATSIPETT